MAHEDPVVKKDEKRLEELEEEIEEARQHLKKLTHDDEPSFIEEGSKPASGTDNAIVPPG